MFLTKAYMWSILVYFSINVCIYKKAIVKSFFIYYLFVIFIIINAIIISHYNCFEDSAYFILIKTLFFCLFYVRGKNNGLLVKQNFIQQLTSLFIFTYRQINMMLRGIIVSKSFFARNICNEFFVLFVVCYPVLICLRTLIRQIVTQQRAIFM